MREIIPAVLFSCFVCITLVNAQSNYTPLPDGVINWRGEGQAHDISIYDTWDYLYRQDGDTIYDTIPYKKLYKNYWNSLEVIGGLRQDTLARKVYFYKIEDTTEYLLYDFSLQVGDTLFGSPYFFQEVVLNHIDTLIVNGYYHRRFHFSEYEPIIEGIGGTGDLLDGWCGLVYCNRLTCVVIDSNNYYPSDTILCDLKLYNNIEEDRQKDKTFQISPNPSSGVIRFELEKRDYADIVIINSLGKVVLYLKLNNKLEQTVNLPLHLHNGLYFIKYEGIEGIFTSRFILQR